MPVISARFSDTVVYYNSSRSVFSVQQRSRTRRCLSSLLRTAGSQIPRIINLWLTNRVTRTRRIEPSRLRSRRVASAASSPDGSACGYRPGAPAMQPPETRAAHASGKTPKCFCIPAHRPPRVCQIDVVEIRRSLEDDPVHLRRDHFLVSVRTVVRSRGLDLEFGESRPDGPFVQCAAH